MTTLRTRDDFVQAARFAPKNVFGVVMAVGYLLFILGGAGLIIAVSSSVFGGPVVWWLATASLGLGVVFQAGASVIVRRRFVRAAKAAGFSTADIREIEDEAERLNAEEGL